MTHLDPNLQRHGIRRSIKTTSWQTVLVFVAAARQFKAWRAEHPFADAARDFPGFDFKRISEDLRAITKTPIRFQGSDNQVFQHLYRLADRRLVSYRSGESTDAHPKFSLQAKGEELYDCLLEGEYIDFLLSPHSKRYAYSLLVLAALRTRKTHEWSVTELASATCLTESQVHEAVRLLDTGFTMQALKSDVPAIHLKHNLRVSKGCYKLPTELLLRDDPAVSNLDMTKPTPAPKSVTPPVPMPSSFPTPPPPTDTQSKWGRLDLPAEDFHIFQQEAQRRGIGLQVLLVDILKRAAQAFRLDQEEAEIERETLVAAQRVTELQRRLNHVQVQRIDMIKALGFTGRASGDASPSATPGHPDQAV